MTARIMSTPLYLTAIFAYQNMRRSYRIHHFGTEKVTKNADISLKEKESFGKALQGKTPDILLGIIKECIPVFGGAIKVILENVYKAMLESGVVQKNE